MKGYWKDSFVKFFCKASEKKSPEISRGDNVSNTKQTLHSAWFVVRLLCSGDGISDSCGKICDKDGEELSSYKLGGRI